MTCMPKRAPLEMALSRFSTAGQFKLQEAIHSKGAHLPVGLLVLVIQHIFVVFWSPYFILILCNVSGVGHLLYSMSQGS